MYGDELNKDVKGRVYGGEFNKDVKGWMYGDELNKDVLRTIFTHFWAGVSHVHVYAYLRNAYDLTSHGQGA